ncbi:LOW QUALITY PROTEIN: metallo-beta-lactamase domain-containing protein 1, partial [Phaenicophaeus curvirostris]|uniref:LOW QUALITY PROTEIN: metallo-beta-lactamase domain-containing protein 1 n=1 Tax=Phaenicophaeus curvirostris TaxID=33595 RepID=UPI0037F0CC50
PMPRGALTSPLGSRALGGSPYSLHVLQEGFSTPLGRDGTFRADGSVTLIRGGPVTALVDTGGPWGHRRLLQALSHHGLSPEGVTHVVCTHGHSDHVGNLNLFPRAELVVGFDVSRGDGVYRANALANGVPYVLHPGLLEVVATPGHTASHVGLVVRETALGTALVAGDLFEKEDDEEEWRAASEDPATQEKSRRWALEVADVIVPGHGPPFRVFREARRRKSRSEEEEEEEEGGEGPKGVLGGGSPQGEREA